MKRVLALAVVAGAALLPVAPAHADHLCVTSYGNDVVCAPHIPLDEYVYIDLEPLPRCVGGRPLICV